MGQSDVISSDPHMDARRPIFHVMSDQGWASDPSGPIFFKGKYHIFFQHNQRSCQWHWGLGWDHAVSDDLVHWQKLPPAILPTPGWYDADGCFTGTVELDPDTGLPTMLYTGVYLKSNQQAVDRCGLPLPEHDLQLRFVETQLAAVPEDPDDPYLIRWRKLEEPFIPHPPPNVPLSCWRDPYCLERGDGQGKEWSLLFASGIRGQGGAVLIFKSPHLLSGWRYEGMVASHDSLSEDNPDLAEATLGMDWECPILWRLEALPTDPAMLLPPAMTSTEAACYKTGMPGAEAAVCAERGFGGRQQEPLLQDDRQPAAPDLPQQSIALSPIALQEAAANQAGLPADARKAAPGPWQLLPRPVSHDSVSSLPDRPTRELLKEEKAAAQAPTEEEDYTTDAQFLVEDLQVFQSIKPQQPRMPPAHLLGTAPQTEHGGPATGQWIFAISPEACNNPPVYWLGDYNSSTHSFNLAAAVGPFRLDLGKTLYACTLYQDTHGRNLLLGWIQEHRRVPPPPCETTMYSYAGCLSIPRCLYIRDGRLFQMPIPEMAMLRTGASWAASNIQLLPGSEPTPLQGVLGCHLDIEATFLPPVDEGVPCRVGILFKSWRSLGQGAAVLVFDWSTHELEMHFDEPFPHAYDPYPDAFQPRAKRVGGKLRNIKKGEPLELRLLLDGSALEVFTGSGEALTTRIYRGFAPAMGQRGSLELQYAAAGRPGYGRIELADLQAPVQQANLDSGIELFSSGAPCTLLRLAAWETGSCWVDSTHSPAPDSPKASTIQQAFLDRLELADINCSVQVH